MARTAKTSSGNPRPVQRIYLECTHTFYNGQNTGIQRVVRNLAEQARTAGADIHVECAPVVWSIWGFLQIDAIPPDGKAAFMLVKRLFRNLYRSVARSTDHADPAEPAPQPPNGEESAPARPPPVPPLPPTPSAAVQPSLSRRALVFGRRVAYLLASAFCHWPTALFTRRVRLGHGDILLLVDASWNQPMYAALRRARAQGCTIGLVVYDVIAVTHEEYFDRPLAASFQDWFWRVLNYIDFYVAISEATCRQVRELMLARHIPPQPLPGRSFLLGTAPTFDATAAGSVRSEVEYLFAPNRHALLCVSTIEPRKNHAFLLDAFDRLQDKMPNLDLILIGRPGWECTALMQRIKTHPLFGQRLFWLHDASDAELDVAYRRARLLVFPSLAEGFGLPIIEALARGLAVVCSDIPVFREVGGRCCRYFPLGDAAALMSAIRAELSSSDEEEAARKREGKGREGGGEGGADTTAGFSWPDWHASTRALLESVMTLANDLPSEHLPR